MDRIGFARVGVASLLYRVRLHLTLLVLLSTGQLQLGTELSVHLLVVLAQLLLHQIIPACQLVAVLEGAVANVFYKDKR